MGANIEFLLNYYFNLYKDSVYENSKKFKIDFKKKHGDFILLNELVVMITKYQVKKYGSSLVTSNKILIEDINLEKAMKYRGTKRI